jgi:peptide/nickel transport system substrate-binding protein
MIHYAVNRTLYSYGPGDNEKPRPDIADGEPQISADQKTITVKLKKGSSSISHNTTTGR